MDGGLAQIREKRGVSLSFPFVFVSTYHGAGGASFAIDSTTQTPPALVNGKTVSIKVFKYTAWNDMHTNRHAHESMAERLTIKMQRMLYHLSTHRGLR